MAFPIGPTNGQITTVNGIKYVYRSATNSWARLGSAKFTAAASAPSNAAQGDRWYNTGLDILFEFINDGTSNYWVDIQSVGQTGNVTSISDSVLNGNIVVGVNNRYSIGTSVGYLQNIYANNITANSTVSNTLVANATTTSTSTTTGALVVCGGAGVAGNVYTDRVYTTNGIYWSGNSASFVPASSSLFSTNIVVTTGTATTNATTGAIVVTGSGGLAVGGVGIFGGNLVAAATTSTSSVTTGALVVQGGAGIGGALFTGGIIDAAGNIIADSGTVSTSTTTGALVVNGGVGVSGNVVTGTNLIFTDTGNRILGDFSNATVANRVFFQTSTVDGITNVGILPNGTGISALLTAFSSSSDTANASTAQFGLFGTEVRATAGITGTGTYLPMTFYTGGSERVKIDASTGNVVIVPTTTSTSTTTGALVVRGGAGFDGNIFTAGWIIPSGNVSQNLGSSTQWWNLVYGKSVQAQYADLAENYVTDKIYVPGTVVVFGGDAEITATTIDHDPRVAGVISTDPAYLMNAATTGQPVALTGRVPCHVQGPVDKGDLLVTSKMSGVAQRLVDGRYTPGCIFAKSLEKIERSEVKLIEVAVGRY